MFESGTMGGRTTSAAAGMLGAHAECEERDAFFDFAMHSQRLYKGLGEELYALSGVDIRQHNGGMFKLAFSEEDVLQLSGFPSFVPGRSPAQKRSTFIFCIAGSIVFAFFITDSNPPRCFTMITAISYREKAANWLSARQ